MSNLLDQCSNLPVRTFETGDTVLQEGKKDGQLLFLKSGSVEIRSGGSAITTISTPGAILGEIAVLLGRGHTASAIALKKSVFYVLDEAERALIEYPALSWEVSRALARRLVRAGESVSNLNKQVEFEADLNDFEMMMLWEEEEL